MEANSKETVRLAKRCQEWREKVSPVLGEFCGNNIVSLVVLGELDR